MPKEDKTNFEKVFFRMDTVSELTLSPLERGYSGAEVCAIFSWLTLKTYLHYIECLQRVKNALLFFKKRSLYYTFKKAFNHAGLNNGA